MKCNKIQKVRIKLTKYFRFKNHVKNVELSLLDISVEYANSLMMIMKESKFIIVINVICAGNINSLYLTHLHRVGKDRAFHCDRCGCCYDVRLKDNHKCKEEILK